MYRNTLPILATICCLLIFLHCSDNKPTKASNHPEFIKLSDSVKISYDSIHWNKPLPFAVVGYDTLFADTFQLKNNYQLLLFPVAEGYDQDTLIVYGHYGRLLGANVDTVLVQAYSADPPKYWLRYENIDFDDCFAVEYSGGGNYSMYINLFDKKTGKIILGGHSGTIDLKNQLIVYLNDETNNMMLYDIERKKETPIKLPSTPCFGSMGYYTGFTITRVSANNVYLRYDCDAPITIRVKR